MAEGGYDTASYIQTVEAGAVAKYGTPTYWIRYFSPSPNGTVNSSSSNASSECTAAWNSGGKHLCPVSSPSQSRLSGTYAEGQADAQTFVSAMISVYQWVAPLHIPTNNDLRCFLDLEASTVLGSSYWEGWASYLNSYNWFGSGEFPFYACLYCNPCHTSNCTTVTSDGGCFAIWSSEPESPYCSYKLSNLPAWHATSCASCVTGGPTTLLWQFAEVNVCGLTVNVDMNEGTMSPYSFYLSAKP